MSDEEQTPIPPEVDARFRALATAVSDQDWGRLVKGTADVAMRKLANCGALDGASPESMEKAYTLLGELMVDFTNVVLTCVAQGQIAQESGQA